MGRTLPRRSRQLTGVLKPTGMLACGGCVSSWAGRSRMRLGQPVDYRQIVKLFVTALVLEAPECAARDLLSRQPRPAGAGTAPPTSRARQRFAPAPLGPG